MSIQQLLLRMHGACHAVNSKHLPRYRAEFCYRFNRRFDLRTLFPRFMSVAVRTLPMPSRLLKLAGGYGQSGFFLCHLDILFKGYLLIFRRRLGTLPAQFNERFWSELWNWLALT